MQTAVIFACVLAVAAAQNWWDNLLAGFNKDDDVVDRLNEFRFEYHAPDNGQHLLIAISDTWGNAQCHVVEVDRTWEPLLQDSAKVSKIVAEIYDVMLATL